MKPRRGEAVWVDLPVYGRQRTDELLSVSQLIGHEVFARHVERVVQAIDTERFLQRTLNDDERRLLYLQTLGLKQEVIARVCRSSLRTINRRMSEINGKLEDALQ